MKSMRVGFDTESSLGPVTLAQQIRALYEGGYYTPLAHVVTHSSDGHRQVWKALRHLVKEGAKQVALTYARGRLDEILSEARVRKCLYCRCNIDLSVEHIPIAIQFTDHESDEFVRRIRVDKIFNEFSSILTLGDMVDIKIALQSRLLNSPGIEPMRRRRRVRKRL